MVKRMSAFANENLNHKDDEEHVRNWLMKEPHLPNEMDEILLKRFLHSCDGSLAKTKITIDLFFTIRSSSPEIFSNRDPFSPEVQQIFKMTDMIPLPKLTEENYKVFIYRMTDPNHDKFDFAAAVKTFLMVADVRLTGEKEFPSGEVPIFDSANVSLKFLTRIVFPILRKYMIYTQEAHPVRLKQIHVINAPPFVDKMFGLVKPLMKSEVIGMCHFHQPNSDTLYKYVPQEILPQEYGGDAGPIKELKSDWIRRVESQRDFFLNDEQWMIDESKRPKQEFDATREIIQMQGSFRTLNID